MVFQDLNPGVHGILGEFNLLRVASKARRDEERGKERRNHRRKFGLTLPLTAGRLPRRCAGRGSHERAITRSIYHDAAVSRPFSAWRRFEPFASRWLVLIFR